MWRTVSLFYHAFTVTLFDQVDPRLRAGLEAEFARRRDAWHEPIPRGVTVVLAGHRAAGKSTLLPHVATLLGRPALDLDVELERLHGRSLREWVKSDESSFRLAERTAFLDVPAGSVVAVGGGFLSLHADLLSSRLVVLVPVSFETYMERLRADTSRPRLRPALSLEDELRTVWEERERRHRQVTTVSLVDFALRAERGARPGRVVTLPPDVEPEAFARRAREAGADWLEVRTDLTSGQVDLGAAARLLPLIISERTAPIPEHWRSLAGLVDVPLETGGGSSLVSWHAVEPQSTEAALEAWRDVAPGSFVKHVEPLGELSQSRRLFDTWRALADRFGASRVTVLATGPFALPFRAVLARQNVLDYVALEAGWAAAPGQRLLADAVREWRRLAADGQSQRLGILGHGIAHSRSPRIHRAPFDRIDLPAEVDLAVLLEALRPYYRGFAVTAPFKKAAALAVGAPRPAVNTLIRAGTGWTSHNSDVDGARATLEALGSTEVTVLGEGGVADALREAAGERIRLRFVRRSELPLVVTGAVVWTWPVTAETPRGLRFEHARVAVIAYGAPARRVAQVIESLGGEPVRLGARWFVAQARIQRDLWAAKQQEVREVAS